VETGSVCATEDAIARIDAMLESFDSDPLKEVDTFFVRTLFARFAPDPPAGPSPGESVLVMDGETGRVSELPYDPERHTAQRVIIDGTCDFRTGRYRFHLRMPGENPPVRTDGLDRDIYLARSAPRVPPVVPADPAPPAAPVVPEAPVPPAPEQGANKRQRLEDSLEDLYVRIWNPHNDRISRQIFDKKKMHSASVGVIVRFNSPKERVELYDAVRHGEFRPGRRDPWNKVAAFVYKKDLAFAQQRIQQMTEDNEIVRAGIALCEK